MTPDYLCMDGTIPRKRLAEMLEAINSLSEKYALRCANVFHAGDGNLHPLIMYDANQPGELERATPFGAEILELSVRFGGTITGEHGVGIEKIDSWPSSSAGRNRRFHRLKAAFDEHGLLNPGKGVPTLARCREYTLARVGGAKTSPRNSVMEGLIDDWTARIADAARPAVAWRFVAAAASSFMVARSRASGSRSAATAASSPTNRPNWWSPRVPARRCANWRRRWPKRAMAALRAAALRAGGDGRRHASPRPLGTAPAGGWCPARLSFSASSC
jgi:hypothetical protein